MSGLLKKMVGKQIRSLRNAKNLTQSQLGEMAELPYSYIGGVERGERNLSLDTLEKIILALGASPSDIFRFINLTDDQDVNKEQELHDFMAFLTTRTTEEILFLQKLASDILKFSERKSKDK